MGEQPTEDVTGYIRGGVGQVAHTFDPGSQEAEAGGFLCVLGHPGLHSKFQKSQNYTEKPCVKNKPQQQNKNKIANKPKKKKKDFGYKVLQMCVFFLFGSRRFGFGVLYFLHTVYVHMHDCRRRLIGRGDEYKGLLPIV